MCRVCSDRIAGKKSLVQSFLIRKFVGGRRWTNVQYLPKNTLIDSPRSRRRQAGDGVMDLDPNRFLIFFIVSPKMGPVVQLK